jgi:Na+-transporting NADH:ubiquinone oxidoreductase subunit A
MGKHIKIKKGFDIKLLGAAQNQTKSLQLSKTFALKPSDFLNLSPKLLVSEGDEILAGQKVFFDKDRPDIGIPSPVSGEIIEIVRAEKRRITHVKILADSATKFQEFKIPSILDKNTVKALLLESGLWSYIRQRPFDMIADTAVAPKAIYVSLFDSAPLAPDYNYVLKDQTNNLKKGFEVLSVLCDAKLVLGISSKTDSSLYQGVNATINTFDGPHPAGNVGIQIHHTSPILPGQVVWYLSPQDVVIIGRLFNTGKYDATRTIALTGSEVKQPQYYSAKTGTTISSFVSDNISDSENRVIQGNVLSGLKSYSADYLSFYCNHLTVLKEGVESEFFGWALPGLNKLSLNRSFFSWLRPSKTYNLDTNLRGEERPFVVTGEYEKVLPMNIMPVFLLKSILAGDIEKMEKLGIYEVSEEDFALCEFVCSSKIEVQKIIRDGLELLRKDG